MKAGLLKRPSVEAKSAPARELVAADAHAAGAEINLPSISMLKFRNGIRRFFLMDCSALENAFTAVVSEYRKTPTVVAPRADSELDADASVFDEYGCKTAS